MINTEYHVYPQEACNEVKKKLSIFHIKYKNGTTYFDIIITNTFMIYVCDTFFILCLCFL